MLPRRRLRLLVACAVFVVGCSPDTRPRDSDTSEAISTAGCTPGQTAVEYPGLSGRTLTIAVSPLAPPYIFTEDKGERRIVGFDADFVEAWTKCLGVEYRWQVYQDVAAMIAAVQSGRADLVQSELFVNPTRAQQVNFVVYMKSLTGSAVAKGNPKKIASLDDLCGKIDAQAVGVVEIALVKGQTEKCQKVGKPPVRLDVYRDNNLAVQALVSGLADAFLGDAVYVKSIATRFPDKVETSFTIDNDVHIGVGINKQQAELRRAILAAVGTIQKNGTQDKLLRKWDLDVKQSVPAYPTP
jgi:polar amino acid transport system substrate-binding protein